MKHRTTIIDQKSAELSIVRAELTGEHEGFIANNEANKYFVKTNYIPRSDSYDSQMSYYLEVLAARFYKYFSSLSITADTSFFVREDGTTNVASRWIDNFTPYAEVGLPYISGDKVVILINGEEREVYGYIEMLLTSRFIGNYDCIGKGVNAGYVIDESGRVINVKIDPGGSFPFVDNKLFNAIFGPVLNLNQKMCKKYLSEHRDAPDFEASIPLEMIDFSHPLMLDSDFVQINAFLYYYFPDFDTRDLLLANIRYRDIFNSPVLYQELSEIIYKIVTIGENTLKSLIYEDMPESINGENLLEIKNSLYEAMKIRRTSIYKLYQEAFKFYRAQLTTHQEIILENIPLINFLDKNNLARKSIKILENLIDHIEAEKITGPDLSLLTKEEFVKLCEQQLKDFQNDVPELSLLHPNTEGVMQLISEGKFDLARAILNSYHKITFNFKEAIIERLPEELKLIIVTIKELYKGKEHLIYDDYYSSEEVDDEYEYIEDTDVDGTDIVDERAIETFQLKEEEFELIKYIRHLLEIFEEAVSYDFSDLENNFVTDILEQIIYFLATEGASYTMPTYGSSRYYYGFPDGGDEGGGYGGSSSASAIPDSLSKEDKMLLFLGQNYTTGADYA